jgi:hypothetical protein
MDVLILQEDQEYGWKVRMKAREYKSRRMCWKGPVDSTVLGQAESSSRRARLVPEQLVAMAGALCHRLA